MLVDSYSIQADEIINCDLCIVGSGAAGLAIANEFNGSRTKVFVLESGSLKDEKAYQQLNRGEIKWGNHPPLERDRRRNFGGTTTVWGGRCVPFDELDFERRSHVKYSGWPITRKDLEPYYARAHWYLDLGDYNYTSLGEQYKSLLSQSSITNDFDFSPCLVETNYRFSLPTNFHHKYYKLLKRSRNVTIFLNGTCLYLNSEPEKKYLEQILVSTLSNRRFYIQAKYFVLAAGGLETTRLLLLSNAINGTQKFGNGHDWLGKFYMSHLSYNVEIQLFHELVWDYQINSEGIYCQPALAISEARQRAHQLLNLRAFIARPDLRDPKHGSSILSATYLAKKIRAQTLGLDDLTSHFRNLLLDAKNLPFFFYKMLSKRIFSQRKLPSVIFHNGSNCYNFQIDSEQVPNPESYITLSEQKDCFGLNRLQVNWRLSEQDIQSTHRAVKLMGQFLKDGNLGKLSSLPTGPTLRVGHHLGTTRMANSPKDGVVDENCRVYGLNNLYVASSSVFPTSSYANPTLTIVALAIRLADRLKNILD